MKIKLTYIIVMITTFIVFNFFYAVAAMNFKKPTSFGQIATDITIIITYPYALLLKTTNINPNGWLLELNFVLLSLISTYMIIKILNLKNQNKNIKFTHETD